MQFEFTPKALANFSPRFEEREPWEPSLCRKVRKECVLLYLDSSLRSLRISAPSALKNSHS
jgi:hypothetical protein